jgi:glycosyltransferase involved in cell wall biosynthesis
MEFIFVDDCSTDNSVQVIQELLDLYPKRSEQVKVVRLSQNKGVSAARQRGLDESGGEFVIHCDADDWVDIHMYKEMYEAAITQNAEVVISDYMTCYPNSSDNKLIQYPDEFVGNPSFCISPYEGAVWNKLISKNLIDLYKITFTAGIMVGEDFLFVTKCRLHACREVVIHKPYYQYCQNNTTSITRVYTKQKIDTVVILAQLMDEYISAVGMKDKYLYRINYLKFQAKQFFLLYEEIRDIKHWQSLFPEIGNDYKQMPVAKYVKTCVWLIQHKMTSVASLILRFKDIYLKLKN